MVPTLSRRTRASSQVIACQMQTSRQGTSRREPKSLYGTKQDPSVSLDPSAAGRGLLLLYAQRRALVCACAVISANAGIAQDSWSRACSMAMIFLYRIGSSRDSTLGRSPLSEPVNRAQNSSRWSVASSAEEDLILSALTRCRSH